MSWVSHELPGPHLLSRLPGFRRSSGSVGPGHHLALLVSVLEDIGLWKKRSLRLVRSPSVGTGPVSISRHRILIPLELPIITLELLLDELILFLLLVPAHTLFI